MIDKKVFFPLLLALLCSFGFSEPLYSPAWGFSLDLPEGYVYTGGDRRDNFSFENPDGAEFDLLVYHSEAGKAAPYASVEALARDVAARLNNRGGSEPFEYMRKKAVVIELDFPGADGRTGRMSGWALCVELSDVTEPRPLLLAMAYGPAEKQYLHALHFSALDSIAPEAKDRLAPGPITEFTFPRKTRVEAPVFGLDVSAQIYTEDAEAAQALIDREFQVLRGFANSPVWMRAWVRFYRAIYRDSFDRLADIAFQVERKLNVPAREDRDLANQALQWVQSFAYERDFLGSDFINLVSAATEGRGDCDSNAMLWAVIMNQANIRSGIMVSRHYSHAMGLADLPGSGARFEMEGQRFLVAETTAKVPIGLIGETVSGIEYWLGILFD